MRLRAAFIVAAGLLVAACGGSAATPSAPAQSPDTQAYWLRMTALQALPPLNLFGRLPVLVITGDGIAVSPGAMPAIYPGPLVPSLAGRPVSGAGQARIIDTARTLGLLDGQPDFSGGAVIPGAIMGRLEITVDGRRVTLTGNPAAQIVCITTPCNPAPGSPEAFGELWRHLADLPSWLGSDLGPESPYVAPAVALLVGAAPQPDPGLPQAPAVWPLETPPAEFGSPVANGTARCGTSTGADLESLRPVLAAANQLTPWIETPDASSAFGLSVRPMVPGENVCPEVFGPA